MERVTLCRFEGVVVILDNGFAPDRIVVGTNRPRPKRSHERSGSNVYVAPLFYLEQERLIDSEPIKRGDPPLVWLKDRHEWVEMEAGSGEHVDSIPISDEEAQVICETGEIPERISDQGVLSEFFPSS